MLLDDHLVVIAWTILCVYRLPSNHGSGSHHVPHEPLLQRELKCYDRLAPHMMLKLFLMIARNWDFRSFCSSTTRDNISSLLYSILSYHFAFKDIDMVFLGVLLYFVV